MRRPLPKETACTPSFHLTGNKTGSNEIGLTGSRQLISVVCFCALLGGASSLLVTSKPRPRLFPTRYQTSIDSKPRGAKRGRAMDRPTTTQRTSANY